MRRLGQGILGNSYLTNLKIHIQLSPCRHPFRGLTGNDSHYYGLLLLRNYGHFCGNKMTILLFWLSIKQTPHTYHITKLICKIAVCCSSFVKIRFKWSLFCLHNSPCFTDNAYDEYCLLGALSSHTLLLQALTIIDSKWRPWAFLL